MLLIFDALQNKKGSLARVTSLARFAREYELLTILKVVESLNISGMFMKGQDLRAISTPQLHMLPDFIKVMGTCRHDLTFSKASQNLGY